MIALIDYGSGNLNAISNIFNLLKIDYFIAKTAADVNKATKIILPGVGSFDHCMKKLIESDLVNALNDKVLKQGIPVLGICIGMHLMADSSEEGKLPGLGWISGRVRKIDEEKLLNLPKLPHMGWNSVVVERNNELFEGINDEMGFYFIHSYYFDNDDERNVLTRTKYGQEFTSGVVSSNIFAVQFHPEKSHSNGMKLLSNFSKL